MATELSIWQEPGAWRKPCIVHVTMVAKDRVALFGTLTHNGTYAEVEKTAIGWTLIKEQKQLLQQCPEVRILADKVMPDHHHMVLHITQTMPRSIKEVVRGYMQGCRAAIRATGYTETMFDGPPYYRVLTQKGQLDAMIQYVYHNAERAWIKRQKPELFKLRRETIVTVGADAICPERTEQKDKNCQASIEPQELHFSSMGNHWLLDWPDKQLIEMSRTATVEQITNREHQAMRAAINGAITITAAISEGEKQIARTIRISGYPLVVLMAEGFPEAGSDAERYYKPGGVYFEACSAGKLLLLEPNDETMQLPLVQQLVEQELRRKAEIKHWNYEPIPPESKRWRFVALNEIGKLIAGGYGLPRKDITI